MAEVKIKEVGVILMAILPQPLKSPHRGSFSWDTQGNGINLINRNNSSSEISPIRCPLESKLIIRIKFQKYNCYP